MVKKRYRYETLFENDIHFGDNIIHVLCVSGLPKKSKKVNGIKSLLYTKNLLDRNIKVEYSFYCNRLKSVRYSYTTFGFVTATHFFKLCHKVIGEHLTEGATCIEFNGKTHWEISNGIVNEHICISLTNDETVITTEIL